MIRSLLLAASLLPLVAACGEVRKDPPPVRQADAAVLGNVTATAGDPALTAALRDQIMVDPSLVQQANADAVRPPPQPASGAVPPDGIGAAAMAARLTPTLASDTPVETLRSAPPAAATCRQCDVARRALTIGALAQAQGGHTGQCASRVSYSADWANRLPSNVPLYPDARVKEAAGADGAGCALRVVSFASAAPLQRMLDWYYTRASAGGYAAEHGAEGEEHILAGNRARGGGAFLVVARARSDGGTDVDVMADGG